MGKLVVVFDVLLGGLINKKDVLFKIIVESEVIGERDPDNLRRWSIPP